MQQAQEIALRQMEHAEKIGQMEAEYKSSEIELKRKRLEMEDTARKLKEEISAANSEKKAKLVLEFLQHIPMEYRESFIKEFLSEMPE